MVFGHPFDTVKGRLQAGKFATAGEAVRTTLAKEGPLAFYKGVLPPCLSVGLISGVLFRSMAFAEATVRARDVHANDASGGANTTPRPLTLAEQTVCGAFAGAMTTPIIAPMELIKLRLQVSRAAAVASDTAGPAATTDAATPTTIRAVLRQVGPHPRRVFGGFFVTFLRECGTFGVFFPANELLKRAMRSPGEGTTNKASALRPGERVMPLWKRVVAGGTAGVICWLPCFPIDQVKTVIQLAASEPGTAAPPSMRQATSKLWRTKGWAGFWRGIQPCLLRAFPAYAAQFAVYDALVLW